MEPAGTGDYLGAQGLRGAASTRRRFAATSAGRGLVVGKATIVKATDELTDTGSSRTPAGAEAVGVQLGVRGGT